MPTALDMLPAMPAPSQPFARLEALTAKQREVLAMVADGLTSKEIARRIGITESAVNQRIETIRQRLGGLPRSQIARLYRHQNTLLVTLPTSNSLTGKPIHLQIEGEHAHPSPVEGAVDLDGPEFNDAGGVLQPSTFFPGAQTNSPLFRLALVVAIALGMISILVLMLDVADKLSRLAA